jgi:hypothetical protein
MDLIKIQGKPSILDLGVQLLINTNFTIPLMSDPQMVETYAGTLGLLFSDLIEKPDERILYVRTIYFGYDLQYMVKPELGRLLVEETDFLERLLQVFKKMHFVDAVSRPDQMMLYEETKGFRSNLLQAELDLLSKVRKYLQYVSRPEDIKRMLGSFLSIFDDLNE